MKKQVYNPYLPSWEYVPDGEPRVFGDRLYVYGSHDLFNSQDYCLGDYVGWSAPADDLSDWRCEGVIYRKDQDPRNKEGKMHMCAPDCVRGKDGRYYLYYQLHAMQCTCVAVGEKRKATVSFSIPAYWWMMTEKPIFTQVLPRSASCGAYSECAATGWTDRSVLNWKMT